MSTLLGGGAELSTRPAASAVHDLAALACWRVDPAASATVTMGNEPMISWIERQRNFVVRSRLASRARCTALALHGVWLQSVIDDLHMNFLLHACDEAVAPSMERSKDRGRRWRSMLRMATLGAMPIVVVLAAPGSHPQPVTSTHLCDMFSPALNAFFGYNLPVLRRRDDGINQPKLARLLVLSLYRP
jgi:hypothetical protein